MVSCVDASDFQEKYRYLWICTCHKYPFLDMEIYGCQETDAILEGGGQGGSRGWCTLQSMLETHFKLISRTQLPQMVAEVMPVMAARAPQNQPHVMVLCLWNSACECVHLPSEACGILPACCFPTGNIALQACGMCPCDRTGH